MTGGKQHLQHKLAVVPQLFSLSLNNHAVFRRNGASGYRSRQAFNFDKAQAGLFVWAKINDKYANGYDLSDQVLDKARVFITPGGIFGSAGENYIRVSLCSTEEKLKESIARIQAAMTKDEL